LPDGGCQQLVAEDVAKSCKDNQVVATANQPRPFWGDN
jgi:hypothetical protein